jgi:hypothetical protein
MNFIKKYFASRELEKILKDLQNSKKGLTMSPATKSILIFVAALLIQTIWTYLQTDQTPTFAEGIKVVVFSLISAALFWVKSGRLPDVEEVKLALSPTTGNIQIHNDDPKDPIKLVVSGEMIPQNIIVASMTNPAPEPKRV